MTKIRALVLDDESHAVSRIVRLLKADEDFEIVGTASNTHQARALLDEGPVDLIFLDINMPGMNGIQFIGSIPEPRCPRVVFVTAHSEYAVQAFEYFALDYVLKPFSNQRFLKTLLRVKQQLGTRPSDVNWKQVENIAIHQQPPLDKLVIKTGRKYEFIPFHEISYVVADGVYALLHSKDGRKLLHREAIGKLEKAFSGFGFTRIHHGTIVQNREVQGLRRLAFGNIEVIMRDQQSLRVSRRYKSEVKKFLNF